MNYTLEFIKEYTCEPPAYLPNDLRERLHFLSCLSEKEYRSVFLVSDKESGEKCILKITESGSPDSAASEHEILCHLEHPGIPRSIHFEEDASGREYILRSYMEGETLDCLLDRDGVFSEAQIYDIVLKLCVILRYLHRQQPPIIYRDINPCNIMLTPNGRVSLIDFGISKKIQTDNKQKSTHTVLVGTIPFIAPEQMGFDKTDHRSDIFALGKLILYLYTGKTDSTVEKNTRIGRLIEKCTRQSKERRFSSIKQLEHAVLWAQKKPIAHAFIKGVALTCVVGIAGFFVWSQITGNRMPPQYPAEASIDVGAVDDNLPLRSPELIAAVRQALMISDDTSLTEEMLENVTRISIGIQNPEIDPAKIVQSKPSLPRDFLGELSYFYNLSELSIDGFRILDLTPIAELPLKTLRMTNCGLSNISALNRLTMLEILDLSGNPIEDIQVLSRLNNLKSLSLSYTDVRDVSALETLSALRDLDLCVTRVTELSPIGSLGDLETLKISHVQIKDFSFLKNLTKLLQLELKSTGFQDISLIASSRLETLDISLNYNYLTDISSLNRFSDLRELDISMSEIEDYSPVYELLKLQTLGIHEDQSERLFMPRQDLTQMPGLKRIILTANELSEPWKTLASQGKITVVLRSYNESY